jgi:hypothetical protein
MAAFRESNVLGMDDGLEKSIYHRRKIVYNSFVVCYAETIINTILSRMIIYLRTGNVFLGAIGRPKVFVAKYVIFSAFDI